MSDGLKYWHMMDAVAQRGPAEKAARAVLVRLARRADSEGISFPGIALLVQETRFSEVTVKRAIAALEFGGWIRIEERAVRVETRRGFERKGNRYHLNLVKLGLVIEVKKDRDEGSCPADRRDGGCGPALIQQADDEGCGPVGVATRGGDEGVCPAASKHTDGRVGWTRAQGASAPCNGEEIASARSHLSGGEVSLEARRGLIGGVPLKKKNKEEVPEGKEPPYAPRRSTGCESPQKQPQRQKLPLEGGGSTNVVVFPKRLREPRQPGNELRSKLFASVRETLDGDEAAMWDEVSEVLRCCGVSPERSGRKTRRAIADALQLHCDSSGASIAEAGELARARWQEYRQLGPLMLSPCGVTGFFASGEWLNPQLWRLSLYGQEKLRRGGL